MKIGIVSDTHSRPLPPQMLKDFGPVEFIIHAGDFCDVADLKSLEAIRPVKAVWGNMDTPSIRKKFPEKQIVEWEGLKIGVYHGTGSKEQVLKSVQEKFAKEKVDVVVFGHSHEAVNTVIRDVLYFNPGSPNDSVCASCCSYGILTAQKGKPVGKIIKVK